MVLWDSTILWSSARFNEKDKKLSLRVDKVFLLLEDRRHSTFEEEPKRVEDAATKFGFSVLPRGFKSARTAFPFLSARTAFPPDRKGVEDTGCHFVR